MARASSGWKKWDRSNTIGSPNLKFFAERVGKEMIMDRRDFLKSAALAVAGTALANGIPILNAAESPSSTITAARNYRPGMPYRPLGKTGVMVSPIGFGLMRLPLLPDGEIDEAQTKQMMHYGIDQGMNYVDTSYLYLNRKSEDVTGRVLQGGYRDKVYIATKSPLLLTESPEDFDRFLDQQLEKLQTDFIDFYLLHMITGRNWEPIVKRFKLIDKIEKAKAQGKVRHIGFSFHASLPIFKQVIDATPNWDFCQIQLNYLDTEYEAGVTGMKYAADRGLGVVIMEPLRGGFLADVPPEVDAIFAASTPKRTPVEWAFNYLWDMPEVGVVLSGMSIMQHMAENIDSAKKSSAGMLSVADKKTISRVVAKYADFAEYPCTGCEYCHSCPKGIAIAQIIMTYNQYKTRGERYAHRYRSFPDDPNSKFIPYGLNGKACDGCGACLCKCPVGINIPEAVKTIHNTFTT